MHIMLNQGEIEQALIAYVSTQGIDISNKDIEVSLTAGRSEKGHTATIEINQVEAQVEQPDTAGETPKAKAKRSAPKAVVAEVATEAVAEEEVKAEKAPAKAEPAKEEVKATEPLFG